MITSRECSHGLVVGELRIKGSERLTDLRSGGALNGIVVE